MPVSAGGRIYQFGYYGVTGDLQEALVCMDAVTGKVIWERRYSDFISDIVYNRYGVGAACVDEETGNVYFQTSPGLLLGFDQEGNVLWERSLMEEFSRLTFPNGRTGGPCVDGDLVIIHAITANWGSGGPARDRFYAFDKRTGELVWFSTPGITPKDSSFAPLIFENLPDGRRVFFVGAIRDPDFQERTALAIDLSGPPGALQARTVWRTALSKEKTYATPLLHEGLIYTVGIRGSLAVVEAKSGKVVYDKVVGLGTGDVMPSPITAGGEIVLMGSSGELAVIRAGRRYEVLFQSKLGEGRATPTLVGNRMYVRDLDRLWALSAP